MIDLENKEGTYYAFVMTAHLLTRQSHRQNRNPEHPPELFFLDDLGLPLARCHELCGNARRTLAMIIARSLDGPVFWIAPGWISERLNPEGMLGFANPGRFTFLNPRRAEDLLWTMEEVLRSGTVPLVIADIPAAPALTPVRRLHLAAETGAADGTIRPLGLLLTPGNGGAQGVESRWHMAGAHAPDGLGWALTRLRARTKPPKAWRVTPQKAGFALSRQSIAN